MKIELSSNVKKPLNFSIQRVADKRDKCSHQSVSENQCISSVQGISKSNHHASKFESM
jgi:hypothetical protein